ncbi:hypothetical protein BD289DRAFT_125262 [Coniella lustricola]|uniref:Uncharacterized protein n=1 Tax=Coniella lustricola TaxID=2025994 RepID=A0A2T3AG13_9PEZI|nr:hypothetical protein BD289DRAFT_125262 [Coniella lustricola]
MLRFKTRPLLWYKSSSVSIDHVVTESNNLYHSAASALVDIHINLQKELVQATARNEQFLNSVSTNHKRFAKPLSATFVGDEQGVEIQIGEHVASFKNRLHTAEAELAALWSQWEASQKEVDKIVMEEYHGQGDTSNDETEASKALNTSLAAEMETLSSELEDILHRAHEDARVSEKNYSKKIHGIMSALLQRYLLED